MVDKATIVQNIQMVDLKGQNTRIKDEIDQAIQTVVDSAKYINGPEVGFFSEQLSDYLDVRHVVPCANGTDALMAALMALDLSPGDEVITTAFTFVATVEVIKLLHLKPVFVDIDPLNFNLDVQQIETQITERTRCIIPVHLFGQPVEMSVIMNIAEKHGIYVIEDNAQSLGSQIQHNGKMTYAGTIGHIGISSFYPSKNLACFGDGGAVFTNDKALYVKIKDICNHGSSTKYQYNTVGINSRLDSIQAAVLSVKLKYLDDYIYSRRAAAKMYSRLLSNHEDIRLPYISDEHTCHQYTVRIIHKDRDIVKEKLSQKGIPTAIYYPKCLHLQEPYKSDITLTEAEKASKEVLSLPMHTELTEDQLIYICENLLDIK